MTDHSNWLDSAAIQTWWDTPSQAAIHRPYSADTVASLRDVFPPVQCSNAMPRKLRGIFEEVQKNKEVSLSSSANDLVGLGLMADAGFETAYVSSSTHVSNPNESALDISHDTFETVPKNVQSLYRSQLLSARTIRLNAPQSSSPIPISSEASASTSPSADAGNDILPLIADAATGHGAHTVIMKHVKLLALSGAAGYHLDDSLSGASRHDKKDGEGEVVVPVCEFLRRLTAGKLQLDIMGSEMLSIARTDTPFATHITSTIDPRDRPYILGSTVPLPRDFYHAEGHSDKAEWVREAKLATLDDAFKTSRPKQWAEFEKKSKGLNVSEAYALAQTLSSTFYWSADAARTTEGWYPYNGGLSAAISRARITARIADVIWACGHGHGVEGAEAIAKGVQETHPGKWMAYNLPAVATTPSDLKLTSSTLASLGYTYLFLPSSLSGPRILSSSTFPSSPNVREAIEKDGVYGYLAHVAREAEKHKADGTDEEWWWDVMGKFADRAGDAVGKGL
ncbi:isocitrate lyase [Cryptococcus floricola]|uniref:methylisocitrate lyase n=1 Tax=Cryptococcus floricola TaxID=2591691 RepID=A0A5D3AWK5_9TREE|nr:isocitrate lyase [Cryptococcus floricola]